MRQHIVPLIALITAALLGWLAYRPGLDGGFLFDDYVNLPALGAFGRIDNATAFWRYLTSGIADFTGRPLSLLSFLIDARDWPADPYPFKRSNLVLHLFNGALLATLLWRLGRIQLGSANGNAALAAVFGAGLWLLHPLFVSTTLYVVQREAMLPATFVLLGLIGYIAGRERAARGQRRGLLLATLSIGLGTTAAVASKANGALLPLLAWTIDSLLLASKLPVRHPRTRIAFTWLRRLLLVAPSILVLAALAWYAAKGFIDGMSAHRAWTLGQRLLTESHVVTEYLGLLWFPRSLSRGLFGDGYPISTGILSPPSTLFCLLLLAGLLGLAIRSRHKHPMIAAAILFFFAGHLMESSVIGLELYFEHRNYLPAMLMFWPLAWLLTQPRKSSESLTTTRLHGLRTALCLALPLLLAFLTWQRAELWGDTPRLARVWAARNPESARAQAWAAQIEMAEGRHADAARRLETSLQQHPHELQLAANAADARCRLQGLHPLDQQRVSYALATDRKPGRLAHVWLGGKLDALRNDALRCGGIDTVVMQNWLDALATNPVVRDAPARQLDLMNLRGRLALLQGDSEQALTLFDQGVDAAPEPATALRQAVALAQAGRPEFGLRHLDHFRSIPASYRTSRRGMPQVHAWLLQRQSYWPSEIDRLRQTLIEEVESATP